MKMMAWIQDDAHARRGLVHGVYAFGHIAVFQAALNLDPMEPLFSRTAGSGRRIFWVHTSNPVID